MRLNNRLTGPAAAWALLALSLVALAGCAGNPPAVAPRLGQGEPPTVPVYVVSHGWHVGLVVPAAALQAEVPQLKERFADAAYYEIGWGDRDFYPAPEMTLGLTLQALFWSQGATLHVVALPTKPAAYFRRGEQVLGTCLTASGVATLSQFVGNSFVRDAGGRLANMGRGIYGDSQFFYAHGNYHIFNNCNNWTARALKSGGKDISPPWMLTAGRIMDFVEDHGVPCAAGPP